MAEGRRELVGRHDPLLEQDLLDARSTEMLRLDAGVPALGGEPTALDEAATEVPVSRVVHEVMVAREGRARNRAGRGRGRLAWALLVSRDMSDDDEKLTPFGGSFGGEARSEGGVAEGVVAVLRGALVTDGDGEASSLAAPAEEATSADEERRSETPSGPAEVVRLDVAEDGSLVYEASLEGLSAIDPTREGRRALRTSTLLRALAAAGRALKELHGDGRAHGDVRAGTVRHGEGRVALVTTRAPIDASALLAARLRAGADAAEVATVAPEVVSGEAATPAADVYGLGALAYSVLAARPPLGRLELRDITAELASRRLPRLLHRSLASSPEERPGVGVLAAALEAEADHLTTEEAEAGGREQWLVEPLRPVDRAERDERRERERDRERQGSSVSVILLLVLALGGFFVFIGVTALVVASWEIIGQNGRLILLALFTAAMGGVGIGLEYAKFRRSGLTLIVLSTALLWVNVGYLLVLMDLEDSTGAWCVGSAILTAWTFLLAGRRGSSILGTLTALGFLVAAVTFGDVISTGSVLGAMTYSGMIAAAYVGLAALGHAVGGRPLGLPFAIAAAVLGWSSAITGWAVLADAVHGGGTIDVFEQVAGSLWAYGLGALGLLLAWRLTGPYRIAALLASGVIVATAPTIEALVCYESLLYLFAAVWVGLGILAASFRAPVIARSSWGQPVGVLAGLTAVVPAAGILCLINCIDRDGLELLEEAMAPGAIFESRFVYLSAVLAISGGLTALGWLFSRHAERKAGYRLLEGAGLTLFFSVVTILSLPDADQELFYAALVLLGGAAVVGLGVVSRRTVLVAVGAGGLILNLFIQYFAKLSQVAHWGFVAVGFGLLLLALAVVYERKVKALLPAMKEWA